MIEIANTGIEAIFSGLMAAFFAQLIKFIIFTIKSKKINFKIFTTTGGMPSSHSAGVMGLSTSVGLIRGFDSIVFAIALGYALITMYDAAGVRRAAGKQAELLNKIVETPGLSGMEVTERLQEVLGHTPIQVFVGAFRIGAGSAVSEQYKQGFFRSFQKGNSGRVGKRCESGNGKAVFPAGNLFQTVFGLCVYVESFKGG